MRSALGPALVILGLASTLLLVLVLLQTMALRTDVDGVRVEVSGVGNQLAFQEAGVTASQLDRQLDELEARIAEMIFAADGFDPDASPGVQGRDEVLDRLDEVLDRLEALDARLDDLCESVPVC